MKSVKFLFSWLMVAMTAVLILASHLSGFAITPNDDVTIPDRVYVLSNIATGNTVLVYGRAGDGTLSLLQQVATEGFGSGAGQLPPPFPPFPGPIPLDSQDALIKTGDGSFLIAVNAGSNDLSVLAITRNGLMLTDRVPSKGIFPVSVAEHNGLVYVANAGQTPDERPGAVPSITGFRLRRDGKLRPLNGSTRVVGGANAAAGDIVFSPDGKALVMTELNGNMVDVFKVGEDNRIVDEARMPANSRTPLGAQFTHGNILAIVESNDSARRLPVSNEASASSYRLTSDGNLVPLSKAVVSGETAAGWIRFTPNGRLAFAVNAGSGSISTYSVSNDGQLTLLNARAVDTGGRLSSPIDADVTGDGKFLYVTTALDGLNGKPQIPLPPNVAAIQVYQIGEDGSLTFIAKTAGLPYTAQGIVAH